MHYKTLGIGIMLHRRKNKINQTDFASRAGISRNYLSMIERGEAQNLSVDVLHRLAEAMEADTCQLLRQLLNGDGA